MRKRTIQSLSVKRYRASPTTPLRRSSNPCSTTCLPKSRHPLRKRRYTLTTWDARSEKVRTDESAFGNFVADVLMNSYEEVLRERDNRGELSERRPPNVREVDCCLICGGSLRGDQTYGPGKIALSDVLEILPFEDAVVCKELKGQDIWDALENGLSMYPKQEGRFPQIAGIDGQVGFEEAAWQATCQRRTPGQSVGHSSTCADDDAMDVDKEDDSEANVGKLRRFSVTKLPGGGYDVEVHRPALVSRGLWRWTRPTES